MSSEPARSLDTALAFADFDFPVFSCWGVTSDGTCLCPKGTGCTSAGKHPIPHDGLKSATTDAALVSAMLNAPGSAGNYGIVPVNHVIVIDADGEGWERKLRGLGLPKTLATQTANGVHLWFYWPEEYGPQPTRLFGWLVRSEEHPGYVLGPGSHHASGWTYRFANQNGHSDYDMIGRIANFPLSHVPAFAPDGPSITVGKGLLPPESIQTGLRHDYLRDRARTLRGGGLTGDDLFNAVSALNRRLPQPKTDEEVRRAIGDVETKFPEDPEPGAAAIEQVLVALQTHPDLIVPITAYRAANSAVPEWCSPLAAFGHVSLVSGPPKSGKSTLIGNLLRAREQGTMFLWGDPVPKGPTLLVTEEGGYPVLRKTVGLTDLSVLDRMAFTVAGLRSLDHLLAALTAWHDPDAEKALVVIDTLAVWGDIKDENDAVAATRAITALRVWAQQTGSAVPLIHHTRKGGGDHGEAIRGSGGIFAAVDQSVELGFSLDPKSDARTLTVVGRLDDGRNERLAYDRDSMTYTLDMAPPPDALDLDDFPVDDGTVDGLTREDAEKMWGLGPSRTGQKLSELAKAGRLVARQVKLPGERTRRNVYWRPRPLLVLDNRSASQEFADIFAKDDDAHDAPAPKGGS